MIAYNRRSLDNLFIRDQAEQAFTAGCILPGENTKIRVGHPVDLYTPNGFICIGLFLLTVVISVFSLGLFGLLLGRADSFIGLLIFFSLASYGTLEYIVYRRHFRSGVDGALQWISAAMLYAGIFLNFENMTGSSNCLVLFIISLFFTLRFANRIMPLIAYMAILGVFINIIADSFKSIQILIPFVLMAFSLGCFLLSTKFYGNRACRFYREVLMTIRGASIAGFYLAGNYFILLEPGTAAFGTSWHSTVISMGWLFWTWTLVIPFLYIYWGIRKKDVLFLWEGLALVAVLVFTIRRYHQLLTLEWAMVLGGLILIALAYGLIRYLKIPRLGFTSAESGDNHELANLHIESLVIAETFAGTSTVPAPAKEFKFGGGSGGGAGAGGEY